jgi:hypothetical protein
VKGGQNGVRCHYQRFSSDNFGFWNYLFGASHLTGEKYD